MAQPSSLPSDLEARLRAFCRVAEDAVSRRAIQQGTIAAAFELSASADATVMKTNFGDVEDVRSLLVDVRKFMLNKEPAHFTSISNLLEQRVRNDKLRDANRKNRRAWKATMHGGIRYQRDDESYDAQRMFNLMVNGGVFHDDDEKVSTWLSLDEMSRGMMQAEVHGLVIRAVRIAHAERNLILAGLEEGAIDLTVADVELAAGVQPDSPLEQSDGL